MKLAVGFAGNGREILLGWGGRSGIHTAVVIRIILIGLPENRQL